jgi:ankyrin repeat protein
LAGFNPNAPDSLGRTPLMWCASSGSAEILKAAGAALADDAALLKFKRRHSRAALERGGRQSDHFARGEPLENVLQT